MCRLRTIAAIEHQRSKRNIELSVRTLEHKAKQASTLNDLLHKEEIEGGLLAAAGFSRESVLRLDQKQRRQIMADFGENVLQPTGNAFVEALLTHFVQQSAAQAQVTPEHTMQAWSRCQLVQWVVSELRISGSKFLWLHRAGSRWQAGTTLWDCTYVEALAWTVGDQPRILVFDALAPLVPLEADGVTTEVNCKPWRASCNVDICLLHSTPDQYRAKTKRPGLIRNAELYVALGELKGGIDPAGADEHWKTASAHLGRIRRSFSALGEMPQLFFVGNAIEASMAGEIWNQLESGELSNAANLTDDRQAVSLVSWLCNL